MALGVGVAGGGIRVDVEDRKPGADGRAGSGVQEVGANEGAKYCRRS
jgi:hypothetical protein